MNKIRDTYLSRLTDEFSAMIDLMLRQKDNVKAIFNGSPADPMMNEVGDIEDQIDRMQVTLRDDVIDSIVLQTPRAGDLRRIMACYDAIVDVERTADILYGICRRMHYLQKPDSIFPRYLDDTMLLFGMAETMLDNAVKAFFSGDKTKAYAVIAADNELDHAYSSCHRKLFAGHENEADMNHAVADLLDIARIYYGIERIGDGSTNIAEALLFLTEGIDVKHNK